VRTTRPSSQKRLVKRFFLMVAQLAQQVVSTARLDKATRGRSRQWFLSVSSPRYLAKRVAPGLADHIFTGAEEGEVSRCGCVALA